MSRDRKMLDVMRRAGAVSPYRLRVIAVFLLLGTTSCTRSLGQLAERHSMEIGAAVSHAPLRQNKRYRQALEREFTMLTPENAMKFAWIHPGQNVYDFQAADEIVAFAKKHNMQVRGHTLVWDQQLPAWLLGKPWSAEELSEVLREHVTTVVAHYQGKVSIWDVVNESFEPNGSLTDSIWLTTIGPEYIERAFSWAHDADPDALLFYNEIGAEGLNQKSAAVYELLKNLLSRGVPVHGVGLQMHVRLDKHPPLEDIRANMDRLSALGLTIHFTELDVAIEQPATNEKLAAQALLYQRLVKICVEHSACTATVVWGVDDDHSWVPKHFPQYAAPLLFDGQLRPKPAYDGVKRGLR